MEMNKMNNLSFGELKTFAQINGTVPAETNNAAIQNSNNNNISNTQSGSQSADSPSMQPQLDKDTVVFFGKEVKKKNIAIGTALIASISALITGIVALSKGKVVAGEDAKLTTKLKEGLKAIFIPSKIKENNIKNGNVETNDKLTPTPKAEEENPNSITSKTMASSPTPKDTETTPKEGVTGNNNDVTGAAASGTPGVSETPQPPKKEEVKGSTADKGKDTQGTGNAEKPGKKEEAEASKNAQGAGTPEKPVLIQPDTLEPVNGRKFTRPISQEKAELHKEILKNKASQANVETVYKEIYSKLSPEMQDALGLEFAEYLCEPGAIIVKPTVEGIRMLADEFTPKDIEKLVQNDETSIRILHSLALPNTRLDQITDVRRGYNLSNKPLVRELIEKNIPADTAKILQDNGFVDALADSSNAAKLSEETIAARLKTLVDPKTGLSEEGLRFLVNIDGIPDLTAGIVAKTEEEYGKALENIYMKTFEMLEELRQAESLKKIKSLIQENAPTPEIAKIFENEEFQKHYANSSLFLYDDGIIARIKGLESNQDGITPEMVKFLIENRTTDGATNNHKLLWNYLAFGDQNGTTALELKSLAKQNGFTPKEAAATAKAAQAAQGAGNAAAKTETQAAQKIDAAAKTETETTTPKINNTAQGTDKATESDKILSHEEINALLNETPNSDSILTEDEINALLNETPYSEGALTADEINALFNDSSTDINKAAQALGIVPEEDPDLDTLIKQSEDLIKELEASTTPAAQAAAEAGKAAKKVDTSTLKPKMTDISDEKLEAAQAMLERLNERIGESDVVDIDDITYGYDLTDKVENFIEKSTAAKQAIAQNAGKEAESVSDEVLDAMIKECEAFLQKLDDKSPAAASNGVLTQEEISTLLEDSLQDVSEESAKTLVNAGKQIKARAKQVVAPEKDEIKHTLGIKNNLADIQTTDSETFVKKEITNLK